MKVLPLAAGVSFTGDALTHLRALVRVLAGSAPSLQRRFLRHLEAEGYDAPRRKALSAITPTSAALLLSKRRPIGRFLELVQYSGRRLAKLNVPPGEAADALRSADRLVEEVTCDRFGPAREQLRLATVLTLNQAYYEVREVETQAFFGLDHAETNARDLPDLLHRFSRVLTRVVQARASSLSLLPAVPVARRRPRYLTGSAKPLDIRLLAPASCYWSFPISAGKEPLGVIEFAFAERYPWLPREAELLRGAAERCGRAIERARLIDEVIRLSASARRAEEEERQRLGRELHDETAQSLLVLRLQLELLEREASAGMRKKLERLRESLERNIVDLRRIIAALSPAILERLGLEAAVRQLTERFAKRSGMRLRARFAVTAGPVAQEVSEAVFRIAQESLQNVLRHSQATQVNLLLRIADRVIRLSVVDNGVGFEADSATGRPMSFGLPGMRERAGLVGGTLRIRSAPGRGTAVVLEVPRSPAET